MAAPAVIPIIKKVVSVVLSSKKGRKAVIYIIATVIIILLLPTIILQSMFSEELEIDTSEADAIIQEQESLVESTLSAIKEQMLNAGYSELKAEEAQAVYLLVLLDKNNQEQFVERLVSCFKAEQTDEELITAVNAEFGTSVNHEEFTEAIQEIRDKYKNQEEKSNEEK